MNSHSSSGVAPIEGILRATSRVERASTALASGRIGPAPMLDLIIARREVEANAATAKVQQETTETLLNVLA